MFHSMHGEAGGGRRRRCATRLFTAVCFVVLAGCGSDAAPQVATGPSSRAEGPVGQALCELGYTAIRMDRLPTGHHKAQVILNGVPATFLVDTGANMTALHAPLAERHGLSDQGIPVGVAGLGGVGRARLVRVKSLTIGGMPIRLGRIATTDLATLSMMPGVLGKTAELDGILGQDVLREHHAIIDVYEHQLFLQADRGPIAIDSPGRCADQKKPGLAEF